MSKEKVLPPNHIANATPEDIQARRQRMRHGWTDSGMTPPTRKVSAEPFDASVATPEEVRAKAKEIGIRIREH